MQILKGFREGHPPVAPLDGRFLDVPFSIQCNPSAIVQTLPEYSPLPGHRVDQARLIRTTYLGWTCRERSWNAEPSGAISSSQMRG